MMHKEIGFYTCDYVALLTCIRPHASPLLYSIMNREMCVVLILPDLPRT